MSLLKIALSPQKLSNPSFRTLKNLATCDLLSNPIQNYSTVAENNLNRKTKKKLNKLSVKMSEVPSKFDEKHFVNFDTLKSICEDILQSNQSTILLKYDHLKQLQIDEFKIDEVVKNFPNLPLAEESRQNFRDIKLSILNVLAIFGGVTPEILLEKIRFDTDGMLKTWGISDYLLTYRGRALQDIYQVLSPNRAIAEFLQLHNFLSHAKQGYKIMTFFFQCCMFCTVVLCKL